MNNSLTRLDSFNRALIGFDTLFDTLERRYTNSNQTNYPPYNICRIDDNHYDIEMAVTGFNKDEVKITIEQNELSIKGEHLTDDGSQPNPVEYLYRGLALRNFEKTFTLAEHMKVVNAKIQNGILTITLEREIPEELKARVIDIVEIK
jgi:molecular chaperone IbpA